MRLLWMCYSGCNIYSRVAGLFTQEEYVARQREVQEQANAAAAAAKTQEDQARSEETLEQQVPHSRILNAFNVLCFT